MERKDKFTPEETAFCQGIKAIVDEKIRLKKHDQTKNLLIPSQELLEREAIESALQEMQDSLSIFLEAIAGFQLALKEDNPILYEKLAEKLKPFSQVLEKQLSFRELIALGKSDPVDEGLKDEVYTIAVGFYNSENYERSFLYFSWLCASDAKNPYVWYLKGVSEQNLEKFEEALASYAQVIAIDPGYIQVYPQIMNSLIMMGDYDTGQKVYDEFTKNIDASLYKNDPIFSKNMLFLREVFS